MARFRPVNPLRRLPFPYRAAAVPRGVEPPPRHRGVGADYDTGWARREPARLTRAALIEGVMRPGIAALARPDRQGADRVEGVEGPVIFAANHHSHIDTPLLVTSIPLRWRNDLVVGAAADYFFGTRLTAATSCRPGVSVASRTRDFRSNAARRVMARRVQSMRPR